MAQFDEEELLAWWDIIEDAVNGRDDNLKCPCDKNAPVEAEGDEHTVTVRCTECGKYVETERPY